MKKSDVGEKIIFFICMIAFVLLFFGLKIYIEYECDELSMVLQVVYTVLTMLFQSFYIFFFIFVILSLLNIILAILSVTLLKKYEKVGEKIAGMINWILEVKHLVIVILLFSCFVPFADTAAYKVADKRVLPIMVVVRQFMDVFEEPVPVTISDCGKGVYTQVLPGKRGKSTSVDGNYIMFYVDGKEYITPMTNTIRTIMEWAEFENMEYEVMMYPNSGMIAEFNEQPQSRYADNQDMLDRLIYSKGEPYNIFTDEYGMVQVIKNEKYTYDDYIKYGIELETLMHLYQGEQSEVEYYFNQNGICYDINMNEEGMHKFVVLNRKELELSKILVVYVENEKVDFYDYDSYDRIYIK